MLRLRSTIIHRQNLTHLGTDLHNIWTSLSTYTLWKTSDTTRSLALNKALIWCASIHISKFIKFDKLYSFHADLIRRQAKYNVHQYYKSIDILECSINVMSIKMWCKISLLMHIIVFIEKSFLFDGSNRVSIWITQG